VSLIRGVGRLLACMYTLRGGCVWTDVSVVTEGGACFSFSPQHCVCRRWLEVHLLASPSSRLALCVCRRCLARQTEARTRPVRLATDTVVKFACCTCVCVVMSALKV
jgi:hypothetical protein